MKLWTRLGALVLIAALLAPAFGITRAQDEAPEVLILPINGAQFLSGAYFDFRIEIHAQQMPVDFAVTINGQAAESVFGSGWTMDSWEIKDGGGALSHSATMRWVRAPDPGEYGVEVTAGGQTHSVTWIVREPITERNARNVILFIADGGSIASYTAARLVSRGMEQGTYNDRLSFESFEEIGFLSTSGIDSIITDSANSASAYNTGHKTAANATGVYPDTSVDTLDDPRTEKFASLVKRLRDMAVGVVTNTELTDATPTAVWAYGRDRSSVSQIDYAAQLLDEGILLDVLMGGGRDYFIPQSVDGSDRNDDRDLLAELEAAGYTIATTSDELQAAVEGNPRYLFGVFNSGNMDSWLDRHVYTENSADFPNQPGLDEMTVAALEVLNRNPNGFYLQVEAGRVDKELHDMDFDRALAEVIEFDRAIAAAVEWAAVNAPDTLIIVTSDHAHGYEVYGTVNVEAFNEADTEYEKLGAIGMYGNAGFPTYEDADGDFYPDSWTPSIALAQGKVDHPPYTEDFQVSPAPRLSSLLTEDGLNVDNPDDDPDGIEMTGNLPNGFTVSGHTLQDVPVYATGPGSSCLGRVQENIEVFFCMAAAIGLDPSLVP
jgi:alkaline phosphatase